MSTEQRRAKLNDIARRGIPLPPGAYLDLEADAPSATVRQWRWWSHVWPRPTVSTWDPAREGNLAHAQASWDDSNAFVSERLAYTAEREQERAEQQQEEEARRQQRLQDASDAVDAELKSTFLASPGSTEQDWERNRDRLRDAHFSRQADEAMEQARAAVRRVL